MTMMMPFEDTATSAYHASIRAKELQMKQKEQKLLEAKEREQLEKEREILKRRFDPDSEDAIGIYPEFLKVKDNEPIDPNHTNTTPNSLLTTAMPEFKEVQLENLLGGDEFDFILNELEKELDAQAMGKDEGEISELGEIIQFLDNSAKTQQTIKPVKDDSLEVLETIASVTKPNKSVSTSSPNEFTSPPSSPMKQSISTSPTKPITAPVAANTKTSPPKVVQNTITSSRTGPSRRSIDFDQQLQNPEDDNNDDDDDDDDDLNWRNRRQNMKKFATEIDKKLAASPEKIEEKVTNKPSNNSSILDDEIDSVDHDDVMVHIDEEEANKSIVPEPVIAHSTPKKSPVKEIQSNTPSSISPNSKLSNPSTPFQTEEDEITTIPIEILDIPETTTLSSGSLLGSSTRRNRGKTATGPLAKKGTN